MLASSRTEVIRRVADVVNLAAGNVVLVIDDAHQGVDTVVNVGKGAFLAAAVDQADILAASNVAEELRDYARRTFLRRVDRVEAGADPVERAEQREIQAFLHAVAPDHTIHELLRTRVDPARLVDRAIDQRRVFRIELAVGAHAVDLGGRREHQVLAVLHGRAHDRQVRLEVEFEHTQRSLHVGGRRGDGDERQNHVALANVVLDPLFVDRDVAFEEVHALVVDQIAEAIGEHVHAINFPVGRLQDALRQMVADEPVDTENQDFFILRSVIELGKLCRRDCFAVQH